MLIEELFSRGVMTIDPRRNVGVFRPEAVAQLPAIRAAGMETFRWIAGDWSHENRVPATRLSPAYTDAGSCRFRFCEKDSWICRVAPDGQESRMLTFDPFSRQWIYLLAQGSYGILRSRPGWIGNRVEFEGLMTMLGIDCEWRMSWTKDSDNTFAFVNAERAADGSWQYIDEWCFTRK